MPVVKAPPIVQPPGVPTTCLATKWLCVGGVEVANACRTLAYLSHVGHPVVTNNASQCCCDDGVYTTPALDDAPWYDPAIPESADVIGVWLEELSTPTPYARSMRARQWGGTLSGTRWGPREIHMVGWVYTRSGAATEYAKNWLLEALAAMDGTGIGSCGLPDAVLWRADGPLDDELRLERTARRVGLIDYKDDLEPDFNPCWGFKFDATLSAEVPFLYGRPETVFDGSVIDVLSQPECNVCSACPVPPEPPCRCPVTFAPREVPQGPDDPEEDERGWNWLTMGNRTAGADVKVLFPNGLVGDYSQDGIITDDEWYTWKRGRRNIKVKPSKPPVDELDEDERGFNWRSMGNGTASKLIRDTFPNGLLGDYNQTGVISDAEWERFQADKQFDPKPLPPQPVRVVTADADDDGYCRPVRVRRKFVPIPPTPYWQTATAIITVKVGASRTVANRKGLKNLRLAAYQNPLGLTITELGGEDYRNYFLCQDPCMTVEVACMPQSSHLIIDGTTRTAQVNCGGAITSGYPFLSSNSGSAFQWPEFGCTGLMLVLETDADNTPSDTTMHVQYVPRDRR